MADTQADIAFDREMVKRFGFYEFMKMAWSHVEAVPYVDSWHLEEMCKALQAVSKGLIKKLAINIPPGTGKSLTVSVFWTAWEWIEDPSLRYINASFDITIVRRDAQKLTKLVQSDWYQARWPQVQLADQKLNPKTSLPMTDFRTTAGGQRLSITIKGKGTGLGHARRHVIDDPSKPRDAKRGVKAVVDTVALQDVIEWWTGTMATRTDNLALLRKVLIMQRLHEGDLVGYVLESEEGWVKLCFPMRYEKSQHCRIELSDGTVIEDRRRTEDELLLPKRYGEVELAELEKTLGPQNTAAQMQQRPAALKGNMFKVEWFKHYDLIPQRFDMLIQSWDMTLKGTSGSDMVGGDLWGVLGADAYLLPGWINKRMSFTETIDEMKRFQELTYFHRMSWQKLVEDKANGPAIVDSLSKQIAGLVLVNPDGGKEARAASVTPFYQSGNVYHPSKHLDPRIEEREAQLMQFPNGKYDDLVDTTSQALLHIFVRSSSLMQMMRVVQADE